MGLLKLPHLLAMLVTLAGVTFAGWYAGKYVKNAEGYATGGKNNGILMAVGVIMSSAMGGACTIGTAQLAYTNGISALWFALGMSLGFVLIAALLAKPMREGHHLTLQGLLRSHYGDKVATVAAVLTAGATFILIITQLVSAAVLLAAMFDLSYTFAALISAALMLVFIIRGGLKSAGVVGFIKLILIGWAMILSGIKAWQLSGGLEGMLQALPVEQYFNLWSRGAGFEVGNLLAMALGMITTQAYLQAIISSRSLSVARKSLVLTALIQPVFIVGGIAIGIYMVMSQPQLGGALAFPVFVLTYISPWQGGIFLAALLVAVIASGAGITFGVTTIIMKELVMPWNDRREKDLPLLALHRLLILIFLILALGVTIVGQDLLILDWTYLSSSLRTAISFVPLCAALYLKDKVDSRAVYAAVWLGPLVVAVSYVLGWEPRIMGFSAGILAILWGVLIKKNVEK